MENKTLKNGVCWYDTDGNPIHAHGGHIVQFNDTYYWYGENRCNNIYVSCYASKDLMNWEFRNNILTTDSKVKSIGLEGDTALFKNGTKINIERPKIVYNEKTDKYIMWAHYENGTDYRNAAIALASSDTPDGDFVYHGFFRPFGHMSRDCNVFKKNGKMYFISSSNENMDLHVYLMKDDYLGVEEQVNKLFVGESREAPALFEVDGMIYMLSSQCTWWRPNQGGYSYSDSMENEWKAIVPFGNETTYRTQPTAVLKLKSGDNDQYVYIGDRWGGSEWDIYDDSQFEYEKSNYYFGLINIDQDGNLQLEPCEEFAIDLNDGFKIIA